MLKTKKVARRGVYQSSRYIYQSSRYKIKKKQRKIYIYIELRVQNLIKATKRVLLFCCLRKKILLYIIDHFTHLFCFYIVHSAQHFNPGSIN